MHLKLQASNSLDRFPNFENFQFVIIRNSESKMWVQLSKFFQNKKKNQTSSNTFSILSSPIIYRIEDFLANRRTRDFCQIKFSINQPRWTCWEPQRQPSCCRGYWLRWRCPECPKWTRPAARGWMGWTPVLFDYSFQTHKSSHISQILHYGRLSRFSVDHRLRIRRGRARWNVRVRRRHLNLLPPACLCFRKKFVNIFFSSSQVW